MTVAYVDTSCLIGLTFADAGASELAEMLGGYDSLVSSNLLEAELRAALVREGVDGEPDLLSWIDWILPDRPLGEEMARVLDAGYARGADLWHLASALWLAGPAGGLPFLTLDRRQGELARRLGFSVGVLD